MSFDGFTGFMGLGSVLSGLGTGMQARAAYDNARLQNQVALANAGIEDMNADYYGVMADNAIARSEKEASDLRRDIGLVQGQQRAGYAAAGVKVDRGSALTTQMETAKWGEYDAQTLLYNGRVEELEYRQREQNSRMSAQMLRSNQTNPGMTAAGVVLNGVTNYSRFRDW